MKKILRGIGSIFSPIFHKRSIIIMSSHRTKHVSFSALMQLSVFALVILCVSLASYSTGNYMAARSVMEEQQETIKSVASSRIDTNFQYTVANMQPPALTPNGIAALPLTDPTFTLSAVSHDKLYARIALLESRVQDLRSTNADIIQTVREKTQDRIIAMEDIIRSTGLNPKRLKHEAQEKHDAALDVAENRSGQGGPFIPDYTPGYDNTALTPELDAQLNEMLLLHDILGMLPFSLPINTPNVESNFGRRIDPFSGRPAFHAGIDLTGKWKAKVLATAPGTVVQAGKRGAYGYAVEIDHGFGVTTRYGHLSSVAVSKGDMVSVGHVVGRQGSTGRSTGPHLHYEVRLNGKPVNPSQFLKAGTHVSQIQ